MKFKIKYNEPRDVEQLYPSTDFEIAKTFSTRLYKEFGEFIRAIVLFGSATKGKKANPKDVDILVIVDDVRIQFTEDIVQTYRIITEKIIADTNPKRLHIQSMKFSAFWEYVRAGDPVATNVLRYGIALIDTGFFNPLQMLLDDGRIRPTPESIASYFAMAPASIEKAESHVIQAGIDLYWGVINAAHAALMHYGEVPPSPEHVPALLEKTLVKEKEVSRESLKTVKEMYKLFKDITRRRKQTFTGKEFDLYKKKADKFVKEMDRYIVKKKR
jgi:predicted nucleotidyltransferase